MSSSKIPSRRARARGSFKRVPDAPLLALFPVPLLCVTVRSDHGSALGSGHPALGANHGVGVPGTFDTEHTLAFGAISHAGPDGSVSPAFFLWP